VYHLSDPIYTSLHTGRVGSQEFRERGSNVQETAGQVQVSGQGVPETWSRSRPDRSISRPVFWLKISHTVFVTEEVQEVQERDCSPNAERYIIDDNDMQDSPTDSPELWIPERNEDDTKFVRVLTDP
jgi:hypothetical protein